LLEIIKRNYALLLPSGKQMKTFALVNVLLHI